MISFALNPIVHKGKDEHSFPTQGTAANVEKVLIWFHILLSLHKSEYLINKSGQNAV